MFGYVKSPSLPLFKGGLILIMTRNAESPKSMIVTGIKQAVADTLSASATVKSYIKGFKSGSYNDQAHPLMSPFRFSPPHCHNNTSGNY